MKNYLTFNNTKEADWVGKNRQQNEKMKKEIKFISPNSFTIFPVHPLPHFPHIFLVFLFVEHQREEEKKLLIIRKHVIYNMFNL